jgi:diguanylate cyclase (GGDEF)-like protein
LNTQYKFCDLINIKKLQSLIESFSNITRVPLSIYSTNGKILICTEQRNICTKFLKLNDRANDNCIKISNEIFERIKKGEKYVIKKCKNGFVNIACPIVIENEVIAVIIASQFYFEKQDEEQCISVAKMRGFDVEKYLKAINEVEILSKKKADGVIKFVKEFTQVVTNMGYATIKEFESEKSIKEAYDKLYNLNKQLEREREEIKFLAYKDFVTGLPNKMVFYKKFKEKFPENCLKNGIEKGALLILGLNNFKNVNDTIGYDYGDKILKLCGAKLKEILNDEALVFKFDSDKFMVFVKNIKEKDFLKNIIEKIMKMFEQQWGIERYKISITASMGVSIFNYDNNNPETIIKNADAAMYKAKELGINKYVFYNKTISEALERKVEIENCLNKALKNKEFYLCYQPQVSVLNNKIEGFEALLRWNSEELGSVSPAEFIPIAEETGLIIPIGEWVMRTACVQNEKWSQEGYKFDHIAVNISAVQLQQLNFVDTVKKVLKETGVRVESFEIEITESTLIKSLDLNIEKLEELKSIGVKIALDDFGTGYSSLNYLKMLPVNRIKIDKSFIDDICTGANEEIIIEGLIFLGHKMNLDIVAEGVELEEQVKILKNKNCDKIQGYYFSKPLKELDAENILKKGLTNKKNIDKIY